MFSKTAAVCPVCTGLLGSLLRGQVCSFPCIECQWIFTWDSKGKLIKPTKLNPRKPDICDCESCKERDFREKHKYL